MAKTYSRFVFVLDGERFQSTALDANQEVYRFPAKEKKMSDIESCKACGAVLEDPLDSMECSYCASIGCPECTDFYECVSCSTLFCSNCAEWSGTHPCCPVCKTVA